VKSQLILDIIADSAECATPVRLEDGTKVAGDEECMGYFGVALQVSLYELRNCNSFEESLVNILKVGGDSDTNGCIGAVLLGAHLGIDAIPKDWIESVLNVPVDRDHFFMEPLKNKNVDEFVRQLANSCCHLHMPSNHSFLHQCSIL
jgi:hypothetical protein